MSNDEEALMYTKVGANGTELALAGLSVKRKYLLLWTSLHSPW